MCFNLCIAEEAPPEWFQACFKGDMEYISNNYEEYSQIRDRRAFHLDSDPELCTYT